ncbi:MAG: hypothetical protein ACEY3K_03565 [Wolbachia sp.]
MAKNPGKKAINIVSKLGLGITIALMTVAVTTAAVIGAVSGIAMSAIIASYFPNLLPMIAGGVIGLGISPLYWTILTGPLVLLFSPIQFGIGVGLTALGLTSPAAVGALSAGLTAAIPFLFMLAGIGIWSGMMSSFMDLDEDKSPSQPGGRLDGGISLSRPGDVFDERADTIFNTEIDADQDSGFADPPFRRNFGFSRPDNIFGRTAGTRDSNFPAF